MDSQQFSPITPNYPSGPRKLSASRSGMIKQNVSSYVYRPQGNQTAKNANTEYKQVRQSFENKGSISGINIVSQLIGEDIKYQNQDIEIERLKTTCVSLNNKASVADDLRLENGMLRKRIEELSQMSELLKQTIAEQDENLDNYQQIRVQMQGKINTLEAERQKDGGFKKDMEKLISNLEKSKSSQIQETNLLINQNKEFKRDLDQAIN